jgi:hypothetical protein
MSIGFESSIHCNTNFDAPDAHFNNLCLFSDANAKKFGNLKCYHCKVLGEKTRTECHELEPSPCGSHVEKCSTVCGPDSLFRLICLSAYNLSFLSDYMFNFIQTDTQVVLLFIIIFFFTSLNHSEI